MNNSLFTLASNRQFRTIPSKFVSSFALKFPEEQGYQHTLNQIRTRTKNHKVYSESTELAFNTNNKKKKQNFLLKHTENKNVTGNQIINLVPRKHFSGNKFTEKNSKSFTTLKLKNSLNILNNNSIDNRIYLTTNELKKQTLITSLSLF